MAKNIVILFDGTSNEISADRTNILRLFGVLQRTDTQIVYYDPGVGTFGAANAWSDAYRKTVEVWGLATGWGLDQNVKDAYRFIVENYEHGPLDSDGNSVGAGDRLYIFGFSRGAYSARVLAGFIHSLGLMSKYHLNLLDYAYNTYKGIGQSEQRDNPAHSVADNDPPSAFATMRLYERTLRTYRPSIKLLGLFDTVSSVIVSGKWFPQLQTLPFTRHNPSVECVRHAMAIDERRTMFNPLPWVIGQPYWGGPFKPAQSKPQDVKEVWFSGVHGDVGGGYPEKESSAIKIPLAWMISQTGTMGLDYSAKTVDELVFGRNLGKPYLPLDALAPLHDSMNFAWKMLEYLPRRVPETSWRKRGNTQGIYLPISDRRFIPDGATVHQSVLDRSDRSPPTTPYAPPNLPQNFAIEPWSNDDTDTPAQPPR
ncbi:DUF2235 domain-containing protein [Rhizobium sp. 2YAF20]|uniref:T6SS phospholipase effector Tle1-like catalytic domain-containing protein n=1 Tax=Rhizobium sp. 2YAF20 TaxID=3233027 RepID=UPI003F96F2AD